METIKLVGVGVAVFGFTFWVAGFFIRSYLAQIRENIRDLCSDCKSYRKEIDDIKSEVKLIIDRMDRAKGKR